MWILYKLIFLFVGLIVRDNFYGSIEIIFPNKKKIIIGHNSSRVKMYIKNNFYLLGLLIYGLPYIGHGYSKGYWSTNNLYQLLKIGINNKKLFKSISTQSTLQ